MKYKIKCRNIKEDAIYFLRKGSILNNLVWIKHGSDHELYSFKMVLCLYKSIILQEWYYNSDDPYIAEIIIHE